MAMTRFQSEARTTVGIQPIFSTRRAAECTALARLSDWSACAIARSLDSKTARGLSPGRICSVLASLLMCRRYPSSVPPCHPRSAVEVKVAPYPASSAVWNSSRAVAHGHSRGACPASGDQVWPRTGLFLHSVTSLLLTLAPKLLPIKPLVVATAVWAGAFWRSFATYPIARFLALEVAFAIDPFELRLVGAFLTSSILLPLG